MRSYVVVWYDYAAPFTGDRGGPGSFRSFDNFEDAMHCLDINIFSGHAVEIWMHDPSHQWNRIRFQTGESDHNDYVNS